MSYTITNFKITSSDTRLAETMASKYGLTIKQFVNAGVYETYNIFSVEILESTVDDAFYTELANGSTNPSVTEAINAREPGGGADIIDAPTSVCLKDVATNKIYSIYIDNGKLKMGEVSE